MTATARCAQGWRSWPMLGTSAGACDPDPQTLRHGWDPLGTLRAGLVRAVVAEMLGISAEAFGGLQVVLQGPSPARQAPTSVSSGLRQAADALSSGMGALPPEMHARSAATAAPSCLLGAWVHQRVPTSAGSGLRQAADALSSAMGALPLPRTHLHRLQPSWLHWKALPVCRWRACQLEAADRGLARQRFAGDWQSCWHQLLSAPASNACRQRTAPTRKARCRQHGSCLDWQAAHRARPTHGAGAASERLPTGCCARHQGRALGTRGAPGGQRCGCAVRTLLTSTHSLRKVVCIGLCMVAWSTHLRWCQQR